MYSVPGASPQHASLRGDGPAKPLGKAGHRERSTGVPCPAAACHGMPALEGAWRPHVRSITGDGCPMGSPSAQGKTLAELWCSLVAPPDVRGLWIYSLDSRSRVNYRLQCLAWLDAEPAPDAWNSQLPPCPCSQPQAELDPRYRQSRGAMHGPPGPAVGCGDSRGSPPALGAAVIPPHHFRSGERLREYAAHCVPQPGRSWGAVSVPRWELARRLAGEGMELPHPLCCW